MVMRNVHYPAKCNKSNIVPTGFRSKGNINCYIIKRLGSPHSSSTASKSFFFPLTSSRAEPYVDATATWCGYGGGSDEVMLGKHLPPRRRSRGRVEQRKWGPCTVGAMENSSSRDTREMRELPPGSHQSIGVAGVCYRDISARANTCVGRSYLRARLAASVRLRTLP